MNKKIIIIFSLFFLVFLALAFCVVEGYKKSANSPFYTEEKKKTVAFNAWGADTLLIGDLNKYIAKKGYRAGLYESKKGVNCSDIDINILFRGAFTTYSRACTGKKNVLWQFYADLYKVYGVEQMIAFEEFCDELVKSSRRFDAVIVSSKYVYDNVKNRIKVPLYYIPQFTNTDKFYFEYDPKCKNKVLFVGHPHFYRVTPALALKNNLPIKIYGEGWPNLKDTVFGYDIDHKELHKYYSSSDIILNDSMPGMRNFGFISNRIYDVSASGGFIISDYSEAIKETFGDSVPMWKEEKELVELVNYYLNHPEERREKIEKARKITLENYTRDKSAEKFVKVLKDLEKRPSFFQYLKINLFKYHLI